LVGDVEKQKMATRSLTGKNLKRDLQISQQRGHDLQVTMSKLGGGILIFNTVDGYLSLDHVLGLVLLSRLASPSDHQQHGNRIHLNGRTL